jgi:hypothetical protein
MGKEQGNNPIVDHLDSIVGLGEGAEVETSGTEQEEQPEQTTPPATTTPSESDTSTAQQSTEQNNALTKEILKIDLEIESLQKQTVDVGDFYTKIEDELSEEEQQLEFSDKPAYLKIVNEKAKAYEAKHSPAATIAELESKKEELIGVQERRSALMSVASKYPNLDVDKVFEFFTNKLNKEQQDEIHTSSSSYADVYEKTFQKYLESNNINIQQQNPPKIPDVNDVRRQILDTATIEDAMSSEEEKLHKALGI